MDGRHQREGFHELPKMVLIHPEMMLSEVIRYVAIGPAELRARGSVHVAEIRHVHAYARVALAYLNMRQVDASIERRAVLCEELVRQKPYELAERSSFEDACIMLTGYGDHFHFLSHAVRVRHDLCQHSQAS